MDQDRRLFVPALNEIKQLRDMVCVGKHQIGLRLDDVIHIELEMAASEIVVGVSGKKAELMALTRWRAPVRLTISGTCLKAQT